MNTVYAIAHVCPPSSTVLKNGQRDAPVTVAARFPFVQDTCSMNTNVLAHFYILYSQHFRPSKADYNSYCSGGNFV